MSDQRETMTEEQKKFCLQVAQWMDRIKTFPGGGAYLTDLLISIAAHAKLEIVDQADPRISLSRDVTQELYDVLWASRELRKVGYSMQTAGKLGLADL